MAARCDERPTAGRGPLAVLSLTTVTSVGKTEHAATRSLFLAPAGLALLVGLDAGLLLAGAPAPWAEPRLEDKHGALMVLGFLGTLIALERAVALRHAAGFAAPALLGTGGLLMILPAPATVGQLLTITGLVALIGVYAALWRRSAESLAELVAVQAVAAFQALVAAALWVRLDLPALVPWLIGFVALTIAAERVELARIAMPDSAVATLCGFAVALTGALTLDLTWRPWGRLAFGGCLVALVVWLVGNDVARRTIRGRGLPRFSAAALLLGYGWLAFGGLVWLLSALPTAGAGARLAPDVTYEIGVHAVFVGFAMSMIVAHAPVILPAILRRPLPYHPVLWLPLAALHLTLAARVLTAMAGGLVGAWPFAALATAVAVLFFVLVAAGLVLSARRGRSTAGHPPAPERRTT